eukprot:maker-scaffold1000_size72005-snap-gene-0.10 protein:Tk09936 transcript:maker-scaffold1000_size72005-snap-gene-0.10-mRNA-1 annotation:"structural maintenance of chromosomes protein 6"
MRDRRTSSLEEDDEDELDEKAARRGVFPMARRSPWAFSRSTTTFSTSQATMAAEGLDALPRYCRATMQDGARSHKRLRILGEDESGLNSSARSCLDQTVRSGVLKEIRLTNFMNHASLHLRLDDGINLLSGRNGSGKSSILQAIVLGLGGQAKDTKRSTSSRSFVRNDCLKAEIRVRVWNGGSQRYRPEVYGKEINFERLIYKSSGRSMHVLKDESGKVVHTDKIADDEKKKICEFLSIQLNNPISILQQEEAKIFFTNTTGHSLYDFFIRATLLKPLQQMYENAKHDLIVCSETLAEKRDNVKEAEAHWMEIQEKVTKIKRVDEEIKKTAMDLEKQILWGYVQSKEIKLKELKNHVQTLSEKKAKEEAIVAESLKSIEVLLEQERESEKVKRMTEAEVKAITMDYNRAKEEQVEAKGKLDLVVMDLETKSTTLSVLREQERSLANSVRSKKTMKDRKNAERDRHACEMKRKKDQVKEDIIKINHSIQDKGKLRDSLSTCLQKLDQDEKDVRAEKLDAQRHQRTLEEDLFNLARSNQSSLKRFGAEFEHLAQDISESRDFKTPPIGPIGSHIRLVGQASEDKNLADLLETELTKGFLRSFLVATWADSKALSKIFGRHFRGRKPPSIVIWQFRGKKDDIRRGQVQTHSEMPGILDYLEIANPEVFNYVVDFKRIETTLVLSQTMAQDLFSEAKNVPRNAAKAITPDFYRFIPATKGNYASYFMERPRGHLNTLVADTRSNQATLEAELAKNKADIATADKALKKVQLDKADIASKKDEAVKTITTMNLKLGTLKQDLTEVNLALTNQSEGDTIPEMETKLKSLRREIQEAESNVQGLKMRKGASVLQERAAKTILAQQTSKMNEAAQALTDGGLSEIKANIAQKQKEVNRNKTNLGKVVAEIKSQTAKAVEAERDFENTKRDAKVKTRTEITNVVDRAQLAAHQKELEVRKRQMAAEFDMTPKEMQEKVSRKKKIYVTLKKQLEAVEVNFHKIEAMQEVRKNVFVGIRQSLIRSVRTIFIMRMQDHGLLGNLEVSHTRKTLNIKVSHLRGSQEPKAEDALPLSSLSGGERSKTLVCLMIASWEYMAPPFRCLDEWDVYLDERSRSMIEEVLFSYAKSKDFQYILISPQGSTLKGANIVQIGRGDAI